MKQIITFIGLLMILTSCANESTDVNKNYYDFNCTIGGEMKADSATLYAVEPDYGSIRILGTKALKDKSVSFSGETNRALPAFLKFNNDKEPYFFVLEDGNISMNISYVRKDSVVCYKIFQLQGGIYNNSYFSYLRQRHNIMNAKKAIWQKYKKIAADSAMTDSIEKKLFARHKLLTDSLQNLTVKKIKAGDPVGKIILTRFGNTINKEFIKKNN
jgi:hypothetical protein